MPLYLIIVKTDPKDIPFLQPAVIGVTAPSEYRAQIAGASHYIRKTKMPSFARGFLREKLTIEQFRTEVLREKRLKIISQELRPVLKLWEADNADTLQAISEAKSELKYSSKGEKEEEKPLRKPKISTKRDYKEVIALRQCPKCQSFNLIQEYSEDLRTLLKGETDNMPLWLAGCHCNFCGHQSNLPKAGQCPSCLGVGTYMYEKKKNGKIVVKKSISCPTCTGIGKILHHPNQKQS